MRNREAANRPAKTIQNSRGQQTNELTFLEHIYELRSRLFWVVLTLIIASAVGYQIKDLLISVIMAPLKGEQLVYLTPGGGFSFIFTLCIYFGALLTIPVAVYHLYRFLQPLLAKTSRRFVAIFISLSGLLAATGTLFGYFVAIPAALNFLTTFAGDTVTPNLTADSYLGFVVAYVLGLAALFQIPLLLFLFDHIRPFPPGGISSTQRFVVIGSTVAAAIITPTPDAMNMAIIAVPIIAVYQIGAFAVFVRHRLRSRKASKLAARAVRQERLIRKISQQKQQQQPRSIPAPQPAFAAIQQAPKRSLDGFTAQTSTRRPVSMASIIPQRPSSFDAPSVSRRMPSSRPVRSIDGFSIT